MKNYIINSINKFRKDALSKLIYDVLKWLFVFAIAFPFSTFIPDSTKVGQFLSGRMDLSVYWFVLICSGIIVFTILFIHIIYRRKYRELQEDNHTDELTGLLNHKAFDDYFPGKIQEAEKTGSSLSVILMDVDNFKTFNTRYTYNTADKILAKLGQLLGNDRRITDEVFRKFNRGDEFIIVASNTKLADAQQAAERKRKLIESTGFLVDDIKHNLTVCCGVTEYKHGEDTIETFIDRVSQALNEAKRKKGKNSTVVNY